MKMARHRISAVAPLLAIALVLLSATSAVGQALRIIPTAQVSPEFALANPTTIYDNGDELPDHVRFKAYLQWSGGAFTDVSHLVDWSSSAPSVFESLGQGEFRVRGAGACVVSASLGDAWRDDLPVSIAQAEGEAGLRGPDPSGAAVPSGVLKQQTLAFIDQLAARGVPVAEFRSAANRCTFHDDRSFVNGFGQHRRWLQSGVLGEYRKPGLRLQWFSTTTWVQLAWFREPTIVLADYVAVSVSNGEFFGNAGEFRGNMSVVLHELLHDVIHESDLEFQSQPGLQPPTTSEEDEEEHWVHTLANAGGLLDKISQSAHILTLPNPTQQDLWRLRNILRDIRQVMSALKARNPALYAQIMHWLGFDDTSDAGGGSNGDGTNDLPDFLDNLLIQRGFNFDNLPISLIPPGGGCEYAWVMEPEDFFKNESGPDSQPFAEVADGCGNLFILSRDPAGSLVLEPAPEP